MHSIASLPIINSGDDSSQSWSNTLHLDGENRILNTNALLLKMNRRVHLVSIFAKQNYIICVFQVNE